MGPCSHNGVVFVGFPEYAGYRNVLETDCTALNGHSGLEHGGFWVFSTGFAGLIRLAGRRM